MTYQTEEPLGVVFTILAALAATGVEAGMAASDAQSAKQQARQATEKAGSAYAATLHTGEYSENGNTAIQLNGRTLTMQKYGALAAVGVVLLIGFIVLRK